VLRLSCAEVQGKCLPCTSERKPPPHAQYCVSGRENLQTGQTEHGLPAGHFKNVVLEASKTLIETGLAVLLCQVVLAYPVPDGQKPPPRTQFCVSGQENLHTGQTEHVLPAGHFKNVDRNWSCRPVVPSCPGLPGTSRTKTAATHPILRFRPKEFADRLNRARATCWTPQKHCLKLVLPFCCVELPGKHLPGTSRPCRSKKKNTQADARRIIERNARI
jgi:hypothetical protein